MAIRSRKNQYLGVNAHLHSHYQNEGGWSGFHGGHITDLARTLNAKLPLGYRVDTEQSLQIREYHPDTGEQIRRRPEPDITLYETAPIEPRSLNPEFGSAAVTLIQPLIETVELDEDQYFIAVVIYEIIDKSVLGLPLTRIELLSPTNTDGVGYLQYREKRLAALKSGLRLVEIDYLHETRSPVRGIPIYPKQPKSYPYCITISDPAPSLKTGLARTYAFSVDSAIPIVPIPLKDSEVLPLDMGEIYNRTFSSMNAYSARVDYEQLPERFETYSAADQERIRRRMKAVQEAYEKGLNLEDGPFPV